MNGRHGLCAILIALGSAFASEGCQDDPRATLDGCGLPTPCGRVFQSHTSETLEPLEDAACIHAALENRQPAHFTVELSDVGTILWDLYVNGEGRAILVTARCELNKPCTEYKVERCVLRPLEELECSMGESPKARVCNAPLIWCADRMIAEPECP